MAMVRTDDEKRAALAQIIATTEPLPRLAHNAGEDFLAYLFEMALDEARSILIAAGHEPPQSGRPVASVVPMVRSGDKR